MRVQCQLCRGGRISCGDEDSEYERAAVKFCLAVRGGEGFNGCFCSLARVSKVVFGNMLWLSFRWLLAADPGWM